MKKPPTVADVHEAGWQAWEAAEEAEAAGDIDGAEAAKIAAHLAWSIDDPAKAAHLIPKMAAEHAAAVQERLIAQIQQNPKAVIGRAKARLQELWSEVEEKHKVVLGGIEHAIANVGSASPEDLEPTFKELATAAQLNAQYTRVIADVINLIGVASSKKQ